MKTAWEKYTGKNLKPVMDFNEDYKKFLDNSKTERESVKTTITLAKKAGFKDLNEVKSLKAGDKVYSQIQDRYTIMAVIGKKPMDNIIKASCIAHLELLFVKFLG